MNEGSTHVLLKRAVGDRQLTRELTPEQLARLQRPLPSNTGAATSTPASGRWLGALTAGIGALAGVLLAVWLLGVATQDDTHDMLERVADEVAANHLKQRPLEVRSDDLATLRGYFTALDFRPVQSPVLSPVSGQLLGGRYCSVQGRIAAQFRMTTTGGQLRTVYEARYDPQVHGVLPDVGRGESPITLIARGVAVRLWVDGGVLFAVTGP